MKQYSLKTKLYDIIFESDTPAGKGFDLLLIASILLSVAVVFLDSVEYYNKRYGELLYILEWFFTILFTLEYFLRIYCIGKPSLYIRSFFGIIDFTVANLLLPINALLIAAFSGWVIKNSVVEEQFSQDTSNWRIYWRFINRYVAPVAIFIVMLDLVTQ